MPAKDKVEMEDPVGEASAEESHKLDKKRQPKQSSRDLRRKTREGLRSRNLGLGLVISSETKKDKSKHVVFEDDFDDQENLQDETSEDEAAVTGATETKDEDHDTASDDDDDEAVEEVKSNVAREQAMQQRAEERETVRVQKLQSQKSKKRKKADQPPPVDDTNISEEEDAFDDDFFAKVDSEMTTKRQLLQGRQEKKLPLGHHTTFVSDGATLGADHNIELVVLASDAGNETSTNAHEERLRAMEARMGTEPSKVAIEFSRHTLVAGDSDVVKVSGTKKSTKAKRKNNQQGWKRSKKMNRLTSSRLRINRRGGRGVAAAHFVKKHVL